MPEYVLEVNNLQTRFNTKNGIVTVLDGVSFRVEKGRILGMVGESGCGKSVTSLSVLRLLPKGTGMITGGEIRLGGENLLEKTDKELRAIRGQKIARIFQDSLSSLNPVIRVGAQIEETIKAHGKVPNKEARERAVEMLRKVGIPSPEKRALEFPHQFSGGMRQRAAIAMALCCSAELLIADEPTTALDVTIQAQILDLMRRLKEEENRSIILITHDMGVIAEMTDFVAVMYSGQIVEYAETAVFFQKPLHPYSEGLMASIPRPDRSVDRLHTIPGTVPNPGTETKGCRFAERCGRRLDLCEERPPASIEINGRQVRCHLYSGGIPV
jgi:peptide/nickel transport system ATP-binding protein/oligopeptide transport system ATP-binding protein